MNDQSSGEKTEPPSPKKIRDARAKGQVAKSQEVVTTITLMASIVMIWMTSGNLLSTWVYLVDQVAVLATGDFRVNVFIAISLAFRESAGILLPILGIVILAAFIANYAQVGSIFAFEGLVPQLNRISIAAGFKRIFSMKQVIETLKSIFKIIFLSILLYFVFEDAVGPYIASLPCGLPCETAVTVMVLRQLLLYSASAFIIVAAIDLMYQRYSYTKGLMMSKAEVKREYKESEGDPHIKQHRKELANELIMGDGGQSAREGTAVVVNPLHLAVVLKYDANKMPLPIVSAKGMGHRANYLRTEAERAGVPIFRNISLARGLYATTEIDEFVPEDLFGAVAEVLAWVEKNRELLYGAPLSHGVIDMDANEHRFNN